MRILLTLLLLATAFAGCTDDTGSHDDGCEDAEDHDACHDDMDGDDGDGDGGEGNETRETVTVEISWDGVYRVNGAYSKDTIRVPANSTVELTFTNNDSAFGHDFVVEDVEGASTAVLGACTQAPCESETITFDVGAPMETKFYCSVPGHRGNGMEGDFIIE